MPEKRLVRSLAELQVWLAPQLASGAVKCVSLDIFDTLVARIDVPEAVQKQVCRQVAALIHSTPEQVWSARQTAETTLRTQNQTLGGDYECRFSELVPLWLTHLHLEVSDTLIQEVIELELSTEALALYVKPQVREFLHWLKPQNIPLYAISDMYLDGIYLERLLRELELAEFFEHIWVSADVGVGKHSGRLFHHIAQTLTLDKASWVHIGDNPHSDRRCACEQGIQGVWLQEPAAHKRLKQQALNYHMAQKGSTWVGQHFFSQIETAWQEDERYLKEKASNFYFNYGREVLGPAFSTFVLGLKQRLEQEKPDTIFFIARDGFLFQQMWQSVANDTQHRYLYLSRQVIAAASVDDGLSLEQAQVAFYNPKQQGLKSVFKVYSLPEDKLKPLALEHGFKQLDERLENWQDSRLIDWLSDQRVQTIIKTQGQKNKAALEGYLQQQGFFSIKKAALVDIGWNGTLQHFLQKTFGEQNDFPKVMGVYFALVPKLYGDFFVNNQAEGIIHDSRRCNDCERVVAEFEEIFEQGARALHGTTIGFEQLNGVWHPVLKPDYTPDRRAELQANPLVEQLQAGVLAYWQVFQRVQRLNGIPSQALLPYVQGLLERAVVYPTPTEVKALNRLAHTEDFGHDHVLSLSEKTFGWRDLLKPLRFIQYLKVTAWRYAAFSHIPTGLANFTLRMVYLHSVKK